MRSWIPWISLSLAGCSSPVVGPDPSAVEQPRAAQGRATAGRVEAPPAAGARRAVIVELFSSEGCSSCPPADEFLRSFAASAPPPDVEVIPLELHVDYWNYLGWADPFSSEGYSDRQRAYSAAWHKRGVYTPEIVVGGAHEIRDWDRTGEAVATSARASIAEVKVEAHGAEIAVAVARAPKDADVLFALTESDLATQVLRGENEGKRLAHAPVVRKLERLGAASPEGAFTARVPLRLEPGWKAEHLRAVAFVQRPGAGEIVGAGAAPLR